MIGMWMVWAVAVTTLLGVSAHLAERALRERGWPVRWAWLSALGGSLALQAWALARPAARRSSETGADAAWMVVDPAWLTELGAAAMANGTALAQRVDTALLVGWIGTAVVATAALLIGLGRLRARSRGWHRARVEGEAVLVSDDFGPALIGLVVPEIVLPRWALDLPAEERRLACIHEAEHRDAHDTWVLFAGALAVSLMPWNVGLWWQMRRLRAAVEIDCDARVLRRGISRRAYGALLLELGSVPGRHPLPVLALARSESLLERRLKMIVRNVRERRPFRSLTAAGVSAALLVVACETPPPTTVDEPEQATFVAAEVEGAPPKEEIAGNVFRFDRGTGIEITEAPEPLIYVDGVRLEGGLPEIEPGDIARIEVLKGKAAAFLHGDEAAGGVIQIFMKEGRTLPR